MSTSSGRRAASVSPLAAIAIRVLTTPARRMRPRAVATAGLLLPVVLAAVLAVPSVAPAIGPARLPARPAANAEPFDVLYLSEARPIVVRLFVDHDRKPIQAEWERFVDMLFAVLDHDKNGRIEGTEAADLQPAIALITGQINRIPTPRRPMTRSQFAEFLRRNDFGPLRINSLVVQNVNRGIRRAGVPTTEELDKMLLGLLDTNKDGKISADEFTAGAETLARLDLDENELISVDEITERPLSPFFFGVQDFNQQQPSPGVELVSLGVKGSDPAVARQLLARYGPRVNVQQGGPYPPGIPQPVQMNNGPAAKRLTKKELKLSDVAFAALDQDGNGELDIEELARFGQGAKPEVEIVLRLGKPGAGGKAVEVIRAGEPPVKTTAGPGDAAIEVPGVRLDFLTGESRPRATRLSLHDTYVRRFQRLDRDGNGYLDRTEAANDQLFRYLFSYLDRDGDGKVFEKELIAALDILEPVAAAAATGLLTIELTESGKGLFGLIDADGDGRLSIPELRAMPKLVERFAKDKTAGLAPGDVPRRFEAMVSLGDVGNNQQQRFGRMDQFSGQPRPQVGPEWFQKMDRNRDGYVSRREFLGTDEEFRKLDLDGDGFISVREAEAAGMK